MRFLTLHGYLKPTCIALLATSLAACGGSEPSAANMVNDASDMAAGVESASAELSQEMKAAAAAPGDMPCELPQMPDASSAQPMAGEGETFTTGQTPEVAAAFYIAAAEARGSSAAAAGPRGLAAIQLTLGDAGNCTVFAQAQMSGGTNIQITKQQ
ncbi:hypothetical protein [Erythrobacter sp. F6033]|uniref:hypothetical protein n=1 Tax=Erythrobacter sp. F6033 TaxID=2926401 RepID=UPI001FF577C6|nr:hypothetical protein [Erythrobacter sp. F6033]MCK0129267.1 hypothetical protein [Erythrobacter sp. F6033]